MRDQEFYEWELRQYESRRRTRNERKRRKSETALRLAVAAWAVLMAAILATGARSAELEGNDSPSPKDAPEAQEMPIVEIEEVKDELPLIYLGRFDLSHYCACEEYCGKWADGMTATGTVATEGRTIAVDPEVIPYGSRVAVFYDDGRIVEYIAEDCGGAIKGNEIDVFVADHDRANELGIETACVYLVNEAM